VGSSRRRIGAKMEAVRADVNLGKEMKKGNIPMCSILFEFESVTSGGRMTQDRKAVRDIHTCKVRVLARLP
jgi:hypothetical protein